MHQITECVIPPRDTALPEPALLTRIRDCVIGDDRLMLGPFGPRPVTYADYTASGRALTLPRGLHPRRGAAPLREHPLGEQRHRAANDPASRGRSPDHPRRRQRRRRHPRDLRRQRLDGRDRQARRHPRAADSERAGCRLRAEREHPGRGTAGGVHRTVRTPQQRAAVARVDRGRGHHPRGCRRSHRPGTAGRRIAHLRRSSAQDRLVQCGKQRHRHPQRHPRHHPPAARARRAGVLGFRRRRAVCRR